MGSNVIVITVDGNKYKIEKNGISDFALIGVMECILTELKGTERKMENLPIVTTFEKKNESFQAETPVAPENEKTEPTEAVKSEPAKEAKHDEQIQSKPGDIKSRILKAREAIRGLKGKVDDLDLEKMNDEELHIEFDELTAQYKRLVNSQPRKK